MATSISVTSHAAPVNYSAYTNISKNPTSTAEREALEELILSPDESQFPVMKLDEFRPHRIWESIASAKIDVFGKCGKFDPQESVKNSFDKGRVKQMFNGLITSTVSSVQGLGGMLLKESNPGWYEYLENGINFGYSDWLSSLQQCEEMQKFMLDAPDNALKMASKQEEMAKYAKTGKVDIVDMFRTGSQIQGDNGVKGVDDEEYGGAGQEPFKVVQQTSKAGYCNLTGDTSSNCSAINQGATSTGSTDVIKEHFPTSEDAETFIVGLVGETTLRTCDDCESVTATPPQSVTQLVQAEVLTIEEQILEIVVSGNATKEKLAAIGTPTYQITDSIIRALKHENTVAQEVFVRRLAFDIASTKMLDKILVARQVLETGRSNANIKGNQVLVAEVTHKLELVDKKLMQFEQEINLRRTIDSGTRLMLNERQFRQEPNGSTNSLVK